MDLIYTLHLDLRKSIANITPVVVSNDTVTLYFEITDGGEPFSLSDVEHFTVNFTRRDKVKVTAQGVVENGKLKYVMQSTETAVVGDLECSLQFFSGETRITTREFKLKVKDDPEGGIGSEQELSLLQQLFVDVDQKGSYAQQSGDYAKQRGDNLSHKGEYSSITAYKELNVVSYGGINYICIKDTVAGTLPTDGTYWTIVSPQARFNSKTWTATEGQTVFTINNGSYVPNSNNLEVSVGGIPQNSGDGFTETNSTSFTFSEGVSAGVTVFARWVEGAFSISKTHKSSHEAGGQDELDVTKLKNYSVIESQLADKANQSVVDKILSPKPNILIIGDSTSAGTPDFSRSIDQWLKYFMGKEVINKGIWGDVLENVYARLDTDVIAYSPKFCIILCGTNNINSGHTMEFMRQQVELITEKLIQNNIKPIWLAVTYRYDNTALQPKIVKWNGWLRYYCDTNNLIFVDSYNALLDASGNVLPLCIIPQDQLHLEAQGTYNIAAKIYERIKTDKNIVGWTFLDKNYSEYFPNTNFQNSADGLLADGWNAMGSGAPTYSLVNIDGGKQQVISKPTTADSTTGGINSFVTKTPTSGALYHFEADIDFSCIDDSGSFVAYLVPMDASLNLIGGSYVWLVRSCKATNMSFRAYTNVVIPNGTVNLQLTIYGASVGAFTLKVKNVDFYKLDTSSWDK